MKPLSDKLIEASEWDIHMPIELRDWLEEAAAVIKRYEDAPVLTADDDGLLFATLSHPGQRVRILLDTEG